MAYTNASVSEMISKFGNRIAAITFDNAHTIHIGYRLQNGEYRKPASVDDIILTSFGGVDMIGAETPISSPHAARIGATQVCYHATSLIQHIVVRNEIAEENEIFEHPMRLA